jgi:hypothetical protein
MAFRGKSKTRQQEFETPEEMYLRGALPRNESAAASLWLHQGDVIRAYAEEYQDTPDLALELPTGTGKTLPGLLIAEWVRRKGHGPVLYATPTRQLAQQVLSTARREGVPATLLVGRARDWDTTDESAVVGGDAVGITTYNAIFNSNPKVPEARLIIFDDAHAGEQFVGNKYGISISRKDEEESYKKVLDALAPFISDLLRQRLEGEPDPGIQNQVRMILPAVNPTALTSLDAVLTQLPEPHEYEFAMIRTGLESCCVYITYNGIQIRPMIPPTFENTVFTRATQRIYLSATLGNGGELERAFGRSNIARMPLPTKTPPRSGRRLFVFPDLVAGKDPVAVTQRILALTGKALILSQETVANTEASAERLAGEGVQVWGRDDLERGGLRAFAQSGTGVLGLANRYDGLDLPGDACRIVVLEGKPNAVGLQERFLSERAGATAVIAERIRTRIVQGAGRCTRGPNDYAVVIILGNDITKYFSGPDNRSPLEPELQAEIAFGWENSRGKTSDEVVENVQTFLEHGDEWRQNGEPMLLEFSEDARKITSLAVEALGRAAPLEVKAWELAFSGKWIDASSTLQEAATLLSPDALRGYRGLLLYIAGVWLFQSASNESETERAHARQLIRQAALAADTRGTWLREMRDLPGTKEIPLDAADVIAINAVVTKLRNKSHVARDKRYLETMLAELAQQESSVYEHGLTTLGTFLGAEASKPKGQGRCDSAWEWGTALWMTLEAKSEEHADGLLPLKDVRQANTQLDQLAADRGMDYPPAGSPAIILSDRLTVDPQHAQAANPDVFLSSTALVREIAADVKTVWSDLFTTSVGIASDQSLRKHVQSVFTENGCLPSQVVNRLTQNRIRPED